MAGTDWINDELTAFDLETTGIDPFVDVPVSYAYIHRTRFGTSVRMESQSGLVNPGRPIPEEAMAVHKITDEMAAEGFKLVDAIDGLAGMLSDAWARHSAIVGMNVSYDLTMIDACCRDLGLASLAERGPIGSVVDVMVLDRHLDRYRSGRRNLGALCEVYGVVNVSAHAAIGDAAASLDVLDAIVARYPQLQEMTLDEVGKAMGVWSAEWLTSFSAYRVERGDSPIEPHRFSWPIYAEPETFTPTV